jgi:acyl-CoA thioesterase-2
VGDLERDTRLEPVDEGRFTACPSREWEIWGPMGGYIAALALRAAGAVTPFTRPASLACHYLRAAEFAPVDVEVTTLRSARTAGSHRVDMTQEGRGVLSALVWSVGDVAGLEHHEVEPPTVPEADALAPIEELMPDTPRPFPFWDNVESRPIDFMPEWPPPAALPPTYQSWARFRPTATFDDPWLDAARAAILIDVQGWPAAHRHHAWREPTVIAPSLDLYVAFHQPALDEPWLLMDGSSPVGTEGLIGWTGRLWSASRRLVASGGGQLLCRPARPS